MNRFFKVERARVIGLSLGGCFAVAVAATHPDLSLSHLLLICRNWSGSAIYKPTDCKSSQIFNEMLGNSTSEIMECEVKFYSEGSDGVGGRNLLEQVQILIDTVVDGHSTPTPTRTEDPNNGTRKVVCRMRIVVATRCKWSMLTIESVP